MYQGWLNDLGVDITTNKTRQKLRLLNHFSGKCLEQPDGKNVLIDINESMKNLLKDVSNYCDYESEAFTLAQTSNIVRREILSYKPLPFTGKFTPDSQDAALPTGLQLFV